MLLRWIVAVSLFWVAAAHAGISFGSAHVIVVDDVTGEVLLEKDTGTAAPIASLTKLMTAMVVLDAKQDPNELLRIALDDVDLLKGTRGRVPVGTMVERKTLIELALIASDNRAASALARHYPGGMAAFRAAVQRKCAELGLEHTFIDEPTGLSPNNRSSALDMAKLLRAAATYPPITESTSKRSQEVVVNGRRWVVRNTNKLVGAPGWDILLSKTGFTNEAGRCVSMRVRTAGRTVTVVLMGALASSDRMLDAANVRRFLAGEPAVEPNRMRAKAASYRARRAAQVPARRTTEEKSRWIMPMSGPTSPASREGPEV